MRTSGGSSARAPKLTLFGFSRLGCTLDGVAGGGAAFVVPIEQDVALVLSAGVGYGPRTLPGPEGARPLNTLRGSVGADVVFRRPNGGSLSVGVGTLPFGFRIGGVW